MEEFKKRLLKERDDLEVKVTALGKFVTSNTFNGLDEQNQDLLKDQLLAMKDYLRILNLRIKLLIG